jgi:hypothetical protein
MATKTRTNGVATRRKATKSRPARPQLSLSVTLVRRKLGVSRKIFSRLTVFRKGPSPTGRPAVNRTSPAFAASERLSDSKHGSARL